MEIIYESFQRWFNGNELTADEKHPDPLLESHRLVL